MKQKNIHSSAQVKEKELTKFDHIAETYIPGVSEGFEPRDLLRFFLVDMIIILSLKLVYFYNLMPNLAIYVIATLLGKVALACYLVWLIASRRHGWQATGATAGGRWWGWPLAVALFILAVPAFGYLSMFNVNVTVIIHQLFGFEYIPAPQDVALILFEGNIPSWIRITLLVFAIAIGPVMEEFAFRGLGMNAFSREGTVVWALLWTSFLFGLYHFDSARIIPLAAIGFMLGLARTLARSLWVPILIHVGYNSGVLIWMWLAMNLPETA